MGCFGKFTYICTPFLMRNYEKTTVKLLKLKDKSFKDANYSTVSSKRTGADGGQEQGSGTRRMSAEARRVRARLHHHAQEA